MADRWLGGLPYYGGKSFAAAANGAGPWIKSLLPWDRDSAYLEPFAGMLSVLLNRAPVNTEVANDVNDRLVNWWEQVRDNPVELEDLIWGTPRSRAIYRTAIGNLDNMELPPVRRALAFYIVIAQAFAAGDGDLSGSGNDWYVNRLGHRRYRPRLHKRAELVAVGERTWIPELAARLREVYIENRDAVDLIRHYAPVEEAVIYCDPPYRDAKTRHYRFGRIDAGAFTEAVAACRGRVAISGYGDEWDHLGWERHEFETTVKFMGKGVRKGRRTEVLWTSFSPPADPPGLLD